MMAKPSMILLDEPSMGLAPQIVEEIFEIVRMLNQSEGVSFLVAEQNANIALRYATYGYIMENGRIVLDGEAKALQENQDVKEFYLGVAGDDRKSFQRRQALQAAQALAGVKPGAAHPMVRCFATPLRGSSAAALRFAPHHEALLQSTYRSPRGEEGRRPV